MGKKKTEQKCKMKVIRKIQMMWDELYLEHDSTTDSMLELTYDKLWEKQMDIGYTYRQTFTK